MKLKAERVEEAKAQELILKEKQVTIDEQKLEIAHLKAMLEKANGHKVMMTNINS